MASPRCLLMLIRRLLLIFRCAGVRAAFSCIRIWIWKAAAALICRGVEAVDCAEAWWGATVSVAATAMIAKPNLGFLPRG